MGGQTRTDTDCKALDQKSTADREPQTNTLEYVLPIPRLPVFYGGPQRGAPRISNKSRLGRLKGEETHVKGKDKRYIVFTVTAYVCGAAD